MKKLTSLILLTALSSSLFAQSPRNLYGFEKSNDIPVIHDAKNIKLAWTGGINNAQVNTIDLNLDGLDDLVLFDKEGKNFHTYITVGSGINAHYEYAPEYELKMPPLDPQNHWALFRDYNCDGKKDIFLGLNSDVYVWKNTSTSTSLSFSKANNGNRIESDYRQGRMRLYVNSANLPGIADIDNDGALDILTYANYSIEMQYHRGQTPCGLDFEEEETCWGHFVEGGASPGVTLNSCIPHKKKTMDGSTTILPIDLDNDQVMDLILGNNAFPSLAALYNGGTANNAHMTSQTVYFPSSHPINIPSSPAAFYEDVDFDGLPDLLVSPTLETNYLSNNKKSLHFYKNTGSANSPNFVFQQKDFLQENMIDVGERSVPRLVDLSGDGNLDLIVSNSYAHIKDTTISHSYYYYQNTGTPTQPEFTLIDTNFMNIASHGISSNSIPCFGDLDGDGDMDALVGNLNGTLHYFKNSSQTSPSFTLVASNFQNIDAGDFAAPFLYDIDSNGTLDLFIGNQDGRVYYYSNNSSTSPNFTLETTIYGGLSIPPKQSGYSIPYLFKKNGSDNLFVGSTHSGIYQFDSIGKVMNSPSLLQPNIGSGTIVSSNRFETPFGTTKKNGRNQFLIRASELRNAGLTYGYIYSISFKITTSSNNDIENLIIKMKNTSDTVLNSFVTQGLEDAYEERMQPKQGWQSFDFNNNFLWDGTSNIIIETCFSNQPKSRDVHVEMTDVGFNANAFGSYVDSSGNASGCQQPYNASSTLRPNIKIVLKPAFANTENYASGLYSAPAVADLNNDGFMDMLVGNMNGGITYYKGKIYDVGINEFRNESNTSLNVFPNPGNGNFMVSTPTTGNSTILVFNLNGALILQKEVTSSETKVNLQKQPNGLYLFLLKNKDSLKTAKVLKQ
ncbi:FG-GAP-like repeat-containing protein [Owenweeksia hongkongensis]|uniref:FG-GAP-like repeat-containing protein n=1 Tax=Owenweeksia hongkongensis TaxID=253245 RepID=UPI003A956428